jgi:hypothetical protein
MCNRSIVFLKDFLAAIMDILILKSNKGTDDESGQMPTTGQMKVEL